MMHEPFYTSAAYINRELGFYVGCVSVKGSSSEHMPVYNERGDLVLFLAGECFADRDVHACLSRRGHEFDPHDVSYVIHLYEEDPDGCLDHLNGWFSGIILDCQNRTALLFNDRYGLKKLYYYEDDKAFFFSSEAKSLLKAFPFLRSVDARSLGEYFVFDCVLENRTYFAGVSQLPAASAWAFSEGRLEKRRYFEPSSWEDQPVLEEDAFFEELSETFPRVVARYAAGGPAAMALSGGLDSRMVLAALNPAPGELPCCTFHGLYRSGFDGCIAPQVAKACSQAHHLVPLDNGFFSRFPAIAEETVFVSDGLAGVRTSHLMSLVRAARHIAPVLMSGKYGNQLRTEFSALRDQRPNVELFTGGFREYLGMARSTWEGIPELPVLSFLLFKEIPWYWAGICAAVSSQITLRSPYLDTELVRLMYRAPAAVAAHGNETRARLMAGMSPELAAIPTNRGPLGIVSGPATKAQQFLYYCLNMADILHNSPRMPHWMARLDSLAKPLRADRLVLGFAHLCHYRKWFRDELAPYVREILLDSRTLDRPYWERKCMERIVRDHTSGRANHLLEISKALTVELLHRLLIEDIS